MFETHIGEDLQQAKQLLEAGELVAIPTETVYGLAANALNTNAVAKIFEAKNRPHFDPLIVHLKSVAEIPIYAEQLSDLGLQLAQQFMPGALTLLVPKKDIIPDLVTSGLSTVGLRIPNHPLTLKLLNILSFPLAAPSANPFGYISPTTAQHVAAQLHGKLPYILNGGNCNIGVESTIVEAKENEIIVHRLGGVSVEELQTVCPNITLHINQSSNPGTPGKLLSHYAPKKQLFLSNNIEALVKEHLPKNIAVITFHTTAIANATAFPLSVNKDLKEASANLFTTMRQLDQSNFDVLLAEYFPDEGLGKAINDRLQRASFL
ncbi:MAG: threonylcarbamoyl-AMP synthase [Chitinophagales bacterium]|nr:threonylcarbamoyl-AMP synthase [Chitinophagales bacterium]